MTMLPDENEIPVLTDTVSISPANEKPRTVDIQELQDALCASSLVLAETMLRDALRESEELMLQRVLGALRAELPGMVRTVLHEHLQQ